MLTLRDFELQLLHFIKSRGGRINDQELETFPFFIYTVTDTTSYPKITLQLMSIKFKEFNKYEKNNIKYTLGTMSIPYCEKIK